MSRALVILGLFNVAAIAVMLGSGVPPQPWLFAAWFVADAIVGLIALGLAERA